MGSPEHERVQNLLSSPTDGRLPLYDGWLIDDQSRDPYIIYSEEASANWSEDLEQLHGEQSRTHFLDVWTRTAILARLTSGGSPLSYRSLAHGLNSSQTNGKSGKDLPRTDE